MALHMIAYELAPPSSADASLTAAIKALGPWVRALESQWLVVTSKSQTEIVQMLSPYIDSADRLIVATLDPANWMARNLPEHVVRWLNSCARALAAGRRHTARATPR